MILQLSLSNDWTVPFLANTKWMWSNVPFKSNPWRNPLSCLYIHKESTSATVRWIKISSELYEVLLIATPFLEIKVYLYKMKGMNSQLLIQFSNLITLPISSISKRRLHVWNWWSPVALLSCSQSAVQQVKTFQGDLHWIICQLTLN